ncbi:hypothetical protein PTKIN_Ptkin17bG0166500 [Pterospermum kingtungense]
MEGEKRKSEVNDDAVLGGSQKKAREDDGMQEITTVTEEEVEEFYAILRRMHVAMNYFQKGNGDVRSLIEMEKAESLNLGSNVEVNGGEEKKKEEENVEENVGFDLNAEPGTGPDPF